MVAPMKARFGMEVEPHARNRLTTRAPAGMAESKKKAAPEGGQS
jgi:hypothetical protein